jgi:hypothetical protein
MNRLFAVRSGCAAPRSIDGNYEDKMLDTEFNTLTDHLERASIELAFAFLEASLPGGTQPSDIDRELAELIAQCQRMVARAVSIAQDRNNELVSPTV